MRIFIIDEGIDRIGGVERIVSILSNEFAKNNNVEIISEFKNQAKPFYDYDSNIKINYLIKKIDVIINKISKKGMIFYILKAIEKMEKVLVLPNRIKQVSKHIKNDDTVVFARVQIALDFLPIFEQLRINPIIIVRDAATIECLNKKQNKKLTQYFPKFVNHFIVSSDESKQNYEKKFGVNKIKIDKIYNPLGITPLRKYDYKSKKIISIGRLHNQKGYTTLIKSFSYVLKKHPDWVLEIYGTGREEYNLKKLIKKKRLESNVKILHSKKNVIELFNSSAIFILPSRYEGYANALVEAMACGIPCITFDWISGAEEIIKNCYNGIIVDLHNRLDYFKGIDNEQDAINLCNAINYLIENKEICDKYSLNSKDIIKSRNKEIVLNRWLSIIEQIRLKNEC